MIVTRGLPLGIDFSGGTLVVVKFEQAGRPRSRCGGAVTSIPGDKVVQQYGDRGRPPDPDPPAADGDGRAGHQPGAGGAAGAAGAAEGRACRKFEIISRDIVGPVIGADLQRRGICATLASMAAITLYIAFRFRSDASPSAPSWRRSTTSS